MKKTTLDEISEALECLGLQKGDFVIIHADLRIFGFIEGNAGGLVDRLQHHVGNEGIISTPSFTFSFPKPFDLSNSHSTTGSLSRLFAKHDHCKRVPDGMTSYYLIGNESESMISQWTNTSYGKGSIPDQLMSKKGKVLQLGTDIMSHIHYLEEVVKVPYRSVKRFEGKIISKENSWLSYTDFYARVLPAKKLIPDPIRNEFFASLTNSINIGGSQLRLFEIERFMDFSVPRLSANPTSLVTYDE